MTLVITHSQVAGTGVDTDAIVDGADWDANHVLTGVISPAQGGTGIVNNDSSTLTISGAFGTTFTVTATTSVTLPTTGTLATLAGSEALTNKTYNGNTWTAGTGTLTLGAGKTFTVSNTLTFTGTDASSVAFGTGGTVLYSGGALGTPSSGTLTNCTGLPISTGLTGTGTGVLTALAVNVGSAGAFVTFNGALGTPSSGTLTNATGLPISTGVSGLGTGIATALAVNTGSAGAPVLFNGALGTPSSGTLTNATGLPVSTGISGLGTGVADFLATPSSANLATAVTGETGSGALVFATSPTLVTPALGTPSSGTLTNCTGLPLAGLATQAAYTIVGNFTGSAAVPTASTIGGLTQKATPAGTDLVLIQDQAASGQLKYATVSSVGASSGVSSLNGETGALISFFPPQGRLTLTSGTPVLTSDVTAATTVYYTPYVGNLCPIYDATDIVPTVFAELSQTLADTTKSPAATTANNNYDMFVWNDSGTIRCTRGPAWTSATARGTGAGTTQVSRVNGMIVNTVAITNGPGAELGTYVGTIRTNGSNQVDMMFAPAAAAGGAANRLYVWNMYNRVDVVSTNMEATDTWNYTTATFRAMNNSGGAATGNATTFIVGSSEDPIRVDAFTRTANSSSSILRTNGIGFDSTSANTTGCLLGAATSVSTEAIQHNSSLSIYPGIGMHYVCPLEYSNASGTCTWYGDGAVPTLIQSGSIFRFRM